MNKEEILAAEKANTEKFFNCAEAPIQEWIADYLNIPVDDVFADYKDDSDVIGFMIGNNHYSAYLVTMPPNTDSLVDKSVLKLDDKAKKACSMLYDAIRKVFMAVTGSLAESIEQKIGVCKTNSISEEQKTNIKSLMPFFIEDKMAFRLVRINRKAMQLHAANEQKVQIQKFLKSNPTDISPEQHAAIQTSLQQIAKVFAENTKEVLDVEEELCKTINENLKTNMLMHIVLEESSTNDAEMLNESMKRLPMFGLKFQDPEEDNYVDKLKKGISP